MSKIYNRLEKVYLVDTECFPDSGIKIHWASFVSDNKNFSLPSLVDEWGEELKTIYLDWVYKLSLFNLNGKQLREHFLYEKKHSLWWLSTIQEKSVYNSSCIYDILRLLALSKLLKQLKVDELIVVSSNKSNKKVFKSALEKQCKVFFYRKNGKTSFSKRNRFCLPFLRAFFVFFKISKNQLMYFFNKKQFNEILKNSEESGITVVSYFPNIDLEKAKKGRFYSRYWEGVHELLDQQTKQVTWLLFYVQGGQCSLKQALNYRKKFESSGQEHHRYVFVEEMVTIRDLFLVMFDFLKHTLKNLHLYSAYEKLLPIDGLNVNLLLENDWKSSFYGSVLLRNLFWLRAFSNYCHKIKKQDLALYLMEGMSWEKAFCTSWRKVQHGRCVGVAHSVVRFFDFRYFDCQAFWFDHSKFSSPRADQVAVVSEGAKEEIIKFGAPSNVVLSVEAVRFLYLKKMVNGLVKEKKINGKTRVLFATDYILASTINQLILFREASAFLNLSKIELIIKPHPFLLLNKKLINKYLPGVQVCLTNETLPILFSKVDIVFSSNLTSVPIEAIYSKIKCIVMIEPGFVNFSPVRECVAVTFVKTGKELAESICSHHDEVTSTLNFYMDDHLTRWKMLITQ